MAEPIATEESHRLIASDRVEGTAVYDRAGERLGTINHFMVDKRTGRAEYAVMRFGGLFGLGSDNYPIPWNLLSYEPARGGYVVDLDRAKLESAPRFGEERPAYDPIYDEQVYGYYGMTYPFL